VKNAFYILAGIVRGAKSLKERHLFDRAVVSLNFASKSSILVLFAPLNVLFVEVLGG